MKIDKRKGSPMFVKLHSSMSALSAARNGRYIVGGLPVLQK